MVTPPERPLTNSSTVAPPLPRAFGKYLLFDCIGRGGVAEIFLARMTAQLGGARRVVVKQILPELSSDPKIARLLVREAKLVTRLNHRNIVRVFDLGRESGRLYIAMEYVEGYDLNLLLRQLTQRKLALPAEFALFIVREVLAGLDYAHRARDQHGTPLGVVHRDVSPSNVLISFEGEVSLCDFGIARAFHRDHDHFGSPARDPEGSRVQRIRTAGKCAYMAPEHARGEEIDARSDLFVAGMLLWELCAGHRLYRGGEEAQLEQALLAKVPPLSNRGLPQQARLQAILDRALAPDPATRYQSAHEMLDDLDHYALSTQLMASQLRFAAFLTEHLADDIVAVRRARELAAEVARQSVGEVR
jgi:eukaryotic-like serine/threonine-protein kinase